MQPRSTILQIALFGFLLSVSQVTRVNAQEPNFDGKTVRIVVGFSAGGGFDAYARAIARHLGKHIPGKPTIIVENMPAIAEGIAGMIALRAIKEAGIRLKGDLTLTAVAFETGNPSVDQHQGIDFPGEGFGTKWVVDRGVVADYALVGETSGFGIVQAECGAAWFKVRVTGREVYTPRFERGRSIQENPKAFAKAAHVIMAIEEWAVGYEKRETMEFAGGTIIPKAQIIQVRGAERVGRPSPFCDLFMDVRIAPGKNPIAVKQEIIGVVNKLNIECEVSLFQYSRGYVAKDAEPLILAVTAAHRYVFNTEPPAPPSAETSMWRDLNVFNEVGIPSICYGPPRQREPLSGAQNRAMKISDLVQATKVYGLTALILCGVE